MCVCVCVCVCVRVHVSVNSNGGAVFKICNLLYMYTYICTCIKDCMHTYYRPLFMLIHVHTMNMPSIAGVLLFFIYTSCPHINVSIVLFDMYVRSFYNNILCNNYIVYIMYYCVCR